MGSKARLLLAEDSQTQAIHIRVFLQERGFDVEIAANGRDALERIRENQPDVVVTDLVMPEMNGLELVEAIQQEYQRLPVVLITARGSEEIATQALRKGAASYVPKKMLESDLIPTLERILEVLQAELNNHRISEYIATMQTEYQLESDDSLVPPLIARLQEDMRQMGICDENSIVQVATALDEALTNAIIHGNLEVSSELRAVDDGKPYLDLICERAKQPPYAERRVSVHVSATRETICFAIKDQGPGFNPDEIPDPTDPANLEKVSGRGLLLINAFMDEVSHNLTGNEITMVKRRAAEIA